MNSKLKIRQSINLLDKWKYLPIILIVISVLLKWFYFTVIYSWYNNNPGHLYNFFVGDDKIYMDFCENFYSKGSYFVKTGLFFDYTFRMPALNFLYYPLRLFLSKELTMDGIIIIQTTLSGIACYFLAKISYILFNSKKIFYLTYLLTCFGFLNAFLNNQLMRESLAFSMVIFSIYFLLKGIDNRKSIFFLYSGFFMTWLIFLRPYTIVLYALIFFILIVFTYQKKITFKNFILYNLIFTIFISLWTIRNYKITNDFMPLESSYAWAEGSKPLKSKLSFIKVFGFHCEPWVFNSQSGWINDTSVKTDVKTINRIFPARTFNGDLNKDSLIKLKEYYNKYENPLLISEKEYNAKQSIRLFTKFQEALKKNKPLDYYFLNRIRLLRSFLSENTFQPFTLFKYPMNILGVFSETCYNFLLKILGFSGLILIFFKMKKNLLIVALVVFFPCFIIFYFPIYSGVDETRFYFLSIPFLMISSSYLLVNMFSKNKLKLLMLIFFVSVPIIFAVQKVTELIHF